MKGILKGSIIGLFVFAMSMVMLSPNAWATSAFARKYGLACNTCHTVAFPRLNYYGEKFMRNGFQIPGGQDGSTKGKAAIADDLTLDERLGDMMGVRGKIRIIEKQQGEDSSGDSIPSTLGSTVFGAIFASGTIAENIPVWVEMETNTSTSETELHNYFVGWNNIGGTTLANLRVGGFTPTEWTSFSDQKRAFDGPVSHPGALRPSSFSKSSTNPYNLRTHTGIEYYGYTGPAFWALGVNDKMGANYDADSSDDSNKDWYLVLRGEMPEGPMEGSSISLLSYWANVGSDDYDPNDPASPSKTDASFKVYDLSANLRMGPLDLLAAYVWDSDLNQEATGSPSQDDDKGYVVEADYKVMKNLMGILRYDSFEDGTITSGDSKTKTWALGVVYTPRENVKLTTSYTLDTSDDTSLTSTKSGTKFGEQNNIWDVELQFMF